MLLESAGLPSYSHGSPRSKAWARNVLGIASLGKKPRLPVWLQRKAPTVMSLPSDVPAAIVTMPNGAVGDVPPDDSAQTDRQLETRATWSHP